MGFVRNDTREEQTSFGRVERRPHRASQVSRSRSAGIMYAGDSANVSSRLNDSAYDFDATVSSSHNREKQAPCWLPIPAAFRHRAQPLETSRQGGQTADLRSNRNESTCVAPQISSEIRRVGIDVSGRCSHLSSSHCTKSNNRRPCGSSVYRSREDRNQHSDCSGDGLSPTTMPSTQTKSKSIPVRRNGDYQDASFQSDASYNEMMYDIATWRMYHRIVSSRTVVPVVRPDPGLERRFRLSRHRLETSSEHGAGCTVETDSPDSYTQDSVYGEVFELEM